MGCFCHHHSSQAHFSFQYSQLLGSTCYPRNRNGFCPYYLDGTRIYLVLASSTKALYSLLSLTCQAIRFTQSSRFNHPFPPPGWLWSQYVWVTCWYELEVSLRGSKATPAILFCLRTCPLKTGAAFILEEFPVVALLPLNLCTHAARAEEDFSSHFLMFSPWSHR